MIKPAMPIRAVVFDLDGLMFNTEELYQQTGTEIMRRRGKAFEAALLDEVMGRPEPVALQIMIDWHQLDVTVQQLAAESEAVLDALLDKHLALMPGLETLLFTLEEAEIPKAIATSSGRRFVEKVLGPFELEPRFPFILTAEDIEHGKPHPDIYLLAAQRLQVPTGEMMVLEDSANGCRAAVAAGAYTVAVPSGHSLTHSFPGAQFIAETLADRRIYQVLGLTPAKRPGR